MKTYDLIFSLGTSCATSQALRDTGLQCVSYPLDWVSTPDLMTGARMIAGDFKDWFNRSDLRLTDVTFKSGHIARIYKNIRTGFGFPHEFTNAKRLEEYYDEVKAKYDRRIARFKRDASSSRRMLVVYLELVKRYCVDARVRQEALLLLRRKFPTATIELAYFYEDPNAMSPELVSDADGSMVVRMDYRTFKNGRLMHVCDGKMIRQWLSENVTSAKSLSVDEMRRFNDEKRKAYRESLGANAFSRWINRKLKGWYADLDQYLIAQGLVPDEHPVWFDEDVW